MRERMLATLLLLLLAAPPPVFSAIPDRAAQAAEYYFAHYDFQQAFSLWSSVFQRQPDNVPALLRLSELRLMFEGHAAVAKSILEYLAAHQGALSREARHALRDKLASLQSVFLTDDGQTSFLQGMARTRSGECAAALPFFSQADAAEKGNVRVLREKAACERGTGAPDRNYATLKRAHELNPFDSDVLDALAEAYLYYQENQRVLELFSAESDLPRTRRQRTAQAVALMRSGASGTALPLLQGLADEKSAVVAPIVYFELGKYSADRPEQRGQAIDDLRVFLTRIAADGSAWDPYFARERIPEAQSLLSRLKNR